ncbi:MAG: hypothetical protein IPJ89_03800 [Candidatus Iainarchaeum archaeon]|uniref:Uncharacterized protein n=1 Tax=Candidatus Iainarchaeum sp. TaxID=3101447 RepID=A0A7T9I1P0_9ARCH|nr:MAG: hypothetical protein IPJ89_03800 [Candidatus Diapherotrites archaeon]
MPGNSPSPRKSLLHRNYHHELIAPAHEHGKKVVKHHVGPIMRKYVIDAAKRANNRKVEELVAQKFPRETVENVLMKDHFLQRRIVTSTTRIAAKVVLDAFNIRDAALRQRLTKWLLAQRMELELRPQRAREAGVPHESDITEMLARVHVHANRDFMPLFMRVYHACIADVENGGKATPRKDRLSK